MTEKTDLQQWAIVELFGHARIAGLLSEQAIGGCAFVRIDVPEVIADGQTLPPVTRLFGQGAIYGITFVDEATARLAAKEIQYQPVSVWSLRLGLEGMPVDVRQRLLTDDYQTEDGF